MTDISASPVLVLGADGTVARATLEALLRKGAQIRALVRRDLPDRDPRVEWVIGDLRAEGVLRNALAGVRTALYVTPHADDETTMAELVVAECRRAGVRLVFVGVHVSGRTARGRLSRLLYKVLMPAYKPKLDLAGMIERTSPEAVMLTPPNFYDNDLLFLPDILSGSFPTPLRGVNRVAVCDIGDVAARALTEPDFPSGTHGVWGPVSLTGAESAAIWAEVLGRPVRYTGDDKAAWEATLCRRVPDGKKRRDWRNSFRTLSWMTMATRPHHVEETTRLLRRGPTTYRDWVQAQVRSGLESDLGGSGGAFGTAALQVGADFWVQGRVQARPSEQNGPVNGGIVGSGHGC